MSGSTIEAEWESHGLICLALALDIGHRCGYVKVPKDHPWFGLDYNDRADGKEKAEDDYDYEARIDGKVKVHGGITYAGTHPGEGTEGGWWFGFDCAHAGDGRDPELMNDEYRRITRVLAYPDEIVRTLEYVKGECEALARQLAAAMEAEGRDG